MAELTNPYTGGRLAVSDDVADAWVARGFRPVEVEAVEEKPAPRRRRKAENDDD